MPGQYPKKNWKIWRRERRHNIQHDDTQHKNIQHNDTVNNGRAPMLTVIYAKSQLCRVSQVSPLC
jgi:hypothetical protein